ncbi:short-chain dehydrogenase [Plenodomus tracheiphilus IPT5]|uniref:Short-chain dehydrogenase n=1 Tax=Plenodomus tracheiphilus IPT5 TaxID=1408161 RepID=A0A6A7AZK0_9PLEO|nr:short-chain dehydrogenase [Plenodomus tracheiphilus IPT5]
MSSPSVYLITGANRGIGKGYVELLLQRPSTTVIAGVRDVSHPTSKALASLTTGEGSKLIVVALDSSKESSAKDAVKTLETEHGIKHLDTVIANAGIANDGSTVRTVTADNIKEHFLVNTIAPVLLFQATADLLKASPSGTPKFVAVSTLIGSVGFQDTLVSLSFPNTVSPYGASKSALNWFVRRLTWEEPWLTSFVFHPGLVETDMGRSIEEKAGVKLSDIGGISVETSVTSAIKVIDGASKEDSGTFKNYDGSPLPW